MVTQILDHITDEIKKIREDIFITEQGFSTEFDDVDNYAKYVYLTIDGEPAGTCRFFPSEVEGDAHIGREAVVKKFRGRQLGTKIMVAAEEAIRKEGYKTCSLDAQVRVKPFYEGLGYEAYGEEHMDEFCPHIMMKKTL